MKIERYKTEYLNEMAQLFHDTVHCVCSSDYTPTQLNAWADGEIDKAKWDKEFLESYTVVSIENGIIVGFGDVSPTGFLDKLYVHKDFQRKGIATSICDQLEKQLVQNGISTIETHSSITARSFFNKRDYFIVKMQTIERKGVKLTNFVMNKSI